MPLELSSEMENSVCSQREEVDEVLSTDAFVERGVFLKMLLLVLSSLEYSPVLIFWFVTFLLLRFVPELLLFQSLTFNEVSDIKFDEAEPT